MKKLTALLLLFLTINIQAQNALDSIAYSIGTELDKSLNEGNSEYFAKLFDSDYFATKFLIHKDNNEDLSVFNKTLKKAVKHSLPEQLINEIKKGSYYNFINYYTDVFNNYYLIFRLYSDEGINYHEYHLVFDKNKTPKIGDLYVFMTGELFSESMSRIYFPNAQKMINENEIEQNTLDLISSYEKLAKIARLISDDKVLSAWIIYNTIPEKIRERKNFLVAGLRMANIKEYDEKYIEILAKFKTLYPNDPSWFLIGMDYYFLKGDYDESLSMLDSLENLTGDDFLNLHRGNIYFQTQDFEKAYDCYFYLANTYPYFEDGINNLLVISITMKKYETSILAINMFIDNLKYTKEDIINFIESDADYQDFKNSKEYINWKDKSD